MELPQPEPAPAPALSPVCLGRGAERPRHLLGLQTGAHGLVGSPERAAASSPVTTLTQTMHNLAGLGSETPKRQVGSLLTSLSLSRRRASESSLSSESSESSDAGLCMDSPSPMDPQMAEQTFEQAIQAASRVIRNKQFAIRRFQSLPVRLLGHSPVLRNITNSQAPGSWRKSEACGRAAQSSGEDKENDGFVFKMPWKPPHPSHAHASAEWADRREAFAQRPNSAPDLMCLTPERKMEVEELSPPARCHFSLIAPRGASEEDDGFVDILESDLKDDNAVPPGMESLISAPLVKTSEKEEEQDLIMYSKCQRLFRSPSMPCSVIRPILKRLERPHDRDLPIQNKRRRSGTLPEEPREAEEPKARVLRSKSLCHDEIETILDSDHRELIGDYSKAFLLQTVDGKHQDLKYISPETMAALLAGKFSNIVERFVIVDCRYPYEYEGGHIKTAVNLPLERDAETFLLQSPITPCNLDKRIILIFHCEFSSERGPRMCRFIRERDRTANDYPSLYYPEMYILKGGYKEFFPQYPTFCEPQDYRPMNHEAFKDELKTFRLKTRSWAGERSRRELCSRLQDQ
ncbi:M-phase inducer phosphatase 2 isoform 2-T2 [Lycaon pictus]|uniref:M-phase inducer phosphatase n=3 Tax=Canis lupus TaxID=9612 RepID=A0A8C0S5P6_CANLF|nr:M-phase inducer phosphatase 2 isoform X2 [Canis lupus dingo]XP_038289167.1 M-phase inducer phosphatase 2 isoform X2 [Canis lupus familiaris]XP_038427640.1 M-phase inducer phosphatase 2 isoform X2 [Canis lupus familiaris]XP_041589290.1 M-phase inducer phosphatase 2 isoform X2 [Vulpes lagopus]XP_850186.2 M-phase inducer phosphatase 2 isoform X2 [Canis lupus familiaris]